MSESKLSKSKDKTIQQMFNNIALNYDKLNNIISLGLQLNIKKRAINKVSLKSDFKILDVCTGTGDIAIYISKNIIKDGKVIGIDFSEKMLNVAKEKAMNVNNIEFKLGDALDLPFKDEEFDACFISFGLRNLSDLKKGLLEMKRVTKRGGFIVNLDTGKPKGILKVFHKLYLFNIVPIFGKFFAGTYSPYKYLPQSTKDFPNGDELVQIFKELGLRKIEKYEYLFGSISQQIGQI